MTHKITMVDLHGQYQKIKPEIDQAIQEVLDSTAFIKGPQVSQFEKSLSDFHDGAHAITCGNGTDALQIAMMALDFKSGDEVILPVFTYVATAEVIALLGLKPVFVDVKKDSFNIDIDQVEANITPKTVAIVPVHLYGQCAEMEPLLALAERNKLFVIEDYAQAFGAEYTFKDGSVKKAGTMGDIGCTSFFPSKNLGCYGDGGALVTTDKLLAEKISIIANHGQRVKYYHDLIGVNSRLDTLQAAILNVKIKHIKKYEQNRQAVADYYDKALSGLPFLSIPVRSANSTHVFHQYTLQLKGVDRDHFRQYLESHSIPSMVYYPVPLHFQKAYQISGIEKGAFPISEKLSDCVISLPIHTEMDNDQLSYICEKIRDYKA
ncbi:MAG TPA: DegT/DnrJ/EryC1/StrS family aminotransferase [Cyclobacteriaceae bacterium]|nr:DegT/DnrJ/EryC1/StrS family aminotransferase [Cyclobacteriaceae bacterium]